MSSSLPEGVVGRAATRADAASAADIVRMSQEALIGRSRMAVPDLLEWWARVDLEHNSWLFEERDRLIAFGWLDPHGGIAGADGFVDPGETERGLGTALVERSEERAHELGLPRIRQWAIAADPRAHVLFETRGYKEVRRFWEIW